MTFDANKFKELCDAFAKEQVNVVNKENEREQAKDHLNGRQRAYESAVIARDKARAAMNEAIKEMKP